MISALSGFALIGVLVLVGWMMRRWGGLPDNAHAVLGRVTFLGLAPCLLFTGVADADLTLLFSRPLLVSTAAACLCFAVFALCCRGRDAATRILGALAAGYTNANNIGLPVATYVLGDATLVVPIVMLQLLVMTPLALILLEVATAERVSWRSALAGPVRNPLIIAVLLGSVVSATGLRLPAVLLDPVTVLGGAAVPAVLLAFGMSLSGRRVLAPGPDRSLTVLATALKLAGMPLIAFLLGLALGLPRDSLYAVTVLATLPTAQNVFLHAQNVRAGLVLVRDTTFLTTVGALPAMLLIAALFTLGS